MESVAADAVLAAIDRSSAALIVLDRDGVVRRWGAGAERVFGWSAAEAEGRPWHEIGLIADQVRRRQAAKAIAATLLGAGSAGEWVARRRDGTSVRVATIHEPIRDADGVTVGLLSLSVDLSSRDRFEAALLREALHDRLTGLPGRSLLHQELTDLLGERRGAPSPRAAVLFIDLDGFKAINDRYGHEAGDRALIEVGRRIRAAVRTDDVVARVGGDEFVVAVRLEGLVQAAIDVTERVGEALAEQVPVGDDVVVDVSASIGVAVADPGEDADAVIRRADAAMYRAKRDVTRVIGLRGP